eukprot:scaffold132502_cov42-Phaeocystis_antarctica.AAC.1
MGAGSWGLGAGVWAWCVRAARLCAAGLARRSDGPQPRYAVRWHAAPASMPRRRAPAGHASTRARRGGPVSVSVE